MGAIALAGSALASVGECEGDSQGCPNRDGGILATGLVAAAGLGLLVTGIVLMGENQNSEVAQDVADPTPAPSAQLLLPRRGEEQPSAADASWRVVSLESPKAFTIPLIGATF